MWGMFVHEKKPKTIKSEDPEKKSIPAFYLSLWRLALYRISKEQDHSDWKHLQHSYI